MKIRAVCFDLDGTLVQGTTVCLHLSRAMGTEHLVADLERKYASGVISSEEAARWDAEAYTHAGRKKADIFSMLASIPEIGSIGETVQRLKAEGIAVVIGTITWAFAAEYFQKKYGFDAFTGTVMGESAEGILTGTIEKLCDEHDKAAFVETYCRARGITMAEVAAVGDSRSDIPLFGKVGLAIALNATPAARQAAHISIDSDDLTKVLEPILPRHHREVGLQP